MSFNIFLFSSLHNFLVSQFLKLPPFFYRPNKFAIAPLITYLPTATAALMYLHHTNDAQCDQIKIAKCLQKLPKNDFTGKLNDFDIFIKIA